MSLISSDDEDDLNERLLLEHDDDVDDENDETSMVSRYSFIDIFNAEGPVEFVVETLRVSEQVWILPLNVEHWRLLGDPTFKNDFRMSRVLFEELYSVLSRHIEWDRNQRVRIDGRIQLMMGLWIFATPDSFQSICRKFGVQKDDVNDVHVRILKALLVIAPDYITWPSLQELVNIRDRFLQKGPFPGVVGVIDGCNVEINRPYHEPSAYYDRIGHYSIKLQVVCDDNLEFRDVYIGQVGSHDDQTVLRRSPFNRVLEDEQALPQDCHFIADDAYLISRTCMVPYKRNKNSTLTRIQFKFNYVLRKSQVTVDFAIARLKTKWRRILGRLDVGRLDHAVFHISACCVLHNFLIRGGESSSEPDELQVARQIHKDNKLLSVPEDFGDGISESDILDYDIQDFEREVHQRTCEGEAKRNDIAASLPNISRPRDAAASNRANLRGDEE